MKAILHPYQEYSKNFILDHPYCALLLDMGLGKTLSSLSAIDELLHTFEIIENVLVILYQLQKRHGPMKLKNGTIYSTSLFQKC